MELPNIGGMNIIGMYWNLLRIYHSWMQSAVTLAIQNAGINPLFYYEKIVHVARDSNV
jgi:hypothetical protein